MAKKTLIEIWKEKNQIVEGIKNSVFKKEDVEEVANQRLAICRTNACGFYDPEGKSENAYFRGIESCGQCGCNLTWLTRSLSSSCSLIHEEGRTPLWDAVLSKEENNDLKEKLGL